MSIPTPLAMSAYEDFAPDHRAVLVLLDRLATCRESDLVLQSGLPLPLIRAVLTDLTQWGYVEDCIEDEQGSPDLIVIPSWAFESGALP